MLWTDGHQWYTYTASTPPFQKLEDSASTTLQAAGADDIAREGERAASTEGGTMRSVRDWLLEGIPTLQAKVWS